MSADDLDLSYISTALVLVPSSTLQNPYSQTASEHNSNAWIAPGGFDESAAFINNDPFMKMEEPIEYPVFNPGSPKEVFAFSDVFVGDVKPAAGDVDLWAGNEDFMNAVLGDDQSLSTFPGLQLNDDLFIAANKESAADIFPSLNHSHLVNAIPPENSDTYKWRGDLGLLDRLAYGNTRQIPRNWNETSLDANQIAQHQSLVLTLPQQSTNLLADHHHADTNDEHQCPSESICLGGALPNSGDVVDTLTHPRKKKRTRIDKKKRETGNNPYGRTGCIYDSLEQLCELCQRRGLKSCIKVSPQGFDRKYLIVHSEPVKHVDSIKSLGWYHGGQDPKLLPITQWLQSQPISRADFNSCDKALNHAVIAWNCRQLVVPEYDKIVSSHMRLTVRYLNFAIETGRARSSGVFASHLLAWVAYSSCSHEVTAPVHFKGSLAFLTSIIDQERNTPDILKIYGPFIIDCANAWTTRNGSIPHRSTSFSQRVKYFDEFRRSDQSGSWHSGILEAANSTLGNLMEVVLTCVYNIARREAAFNFSRDNIADVLQYIRSELGDADLYSCLKTIYGAFQGPQTNYTTVEGQLVTRLFHRLRCILLLLTLLEAESVENGVLTPKANFIACSVIRHCRSQAIRRGGPIEDYYCISWHNFSHLLLGGVALPIEECAELCAWVTSELRFIGKDHCAQTLERYWRERSVEDLAQILKFAQFPEPMGEN